MKTLLKILIIIICAVSVQSCDIQKKALKNKTASKTNLDKTEKVNIIKVDSAKSNRYDFTKTNIDLEEFEFKPTNPLFTMEIVTQKGDTLKAKNATISKKKQNTQTFNNKREETFNNKQEQTNTNFVDNSVIDETSKFKDTEKEENFDSSFILYIVIGAVCLFGLLGSVALFLMYKTINKNSAALNELLKMINS